MVNSGIRHTLLNGSRVISNVEVKGGLPAVSIELLQLAIDEMTIQKVMEE